MSKPQTLDEVLEASQRFIDDDELQAQARAQAKSVLSAMVEEIIGQDTGKEFDGTRSIDSLRAKQRERAKQLGFIIGGSNE